VAFVAQHGGEVHLGQRVRHDGIDEDGVSVTTPLRQATYDAVVIAVGPHQLAQVDVTHGGPAWSEVLERVAALQYESINTIHLGYTDAAVRAPLERLDDAPGQWVFDGGIILFKGEPLRLLSVVISANGAHDALPQPQLVREVDAQLRRLSSGLGALRFSQVFAEQRATYACTPGLSRPAPGTVSPRLHLAGDYTHPEFPATLEAAVQSGKIAARSVLRELADGSKVAVVQA
jgi:predicted NAD/FAD-dependent oxidoreductase